MEQGADFNQMTEIHSCSKTFVRVHVRESIVGSASGLTCHWGRVLMMKVGFDASKVWFMVTLLLSVFIHSSSQKS
jgi:hypothetical protein